MTRFRNPEDNNVDFIAVATLEKHSAVIFPIFKDMVFGK
jgi:hypothetical protein